MLDNLQYILNDDGTTSKVSFEEYLALVKADREGFHKRRIVHQVHVKRGKHKLFVSTVFLGLNHQYGQGPPLIFETMIFGDRNLVEQYCDRYSTLEEAKAGHAVAVEIARQRL